MAERKECIVSDLSIAQPSDALSETPARDRWLVMPYEGEVSGKMLWAPVRNAPPAVEVPLPDLGLCDIHIGIYGSGTVPIWFNLIGGRTTNTKAYNRLRLRLSDEDWFDTMIPEHYPEQPRFTYISESHWKTADVSRKKIVFATDPREAYRDTTILVAYVRLVPVERSAAWPAETKRLSVYMDSNFCGHYVDSVADIKSHIEPLREGDYDSVFWTACREDSCYYPTRIGNAMPPDTMPGVYPYWAGRDMKRMLDRGEDPLKAACDVARDCGLKLFASYRRMTVRMPPFLFPLHPDAMFCRRRDLWCADEKGRPVPHLSLAFPEVRRRTIALFSELAENYDIDGVHMFFSRGMPFVYFEKPVLEAFRETHKTDPRGLPCADERLGEIRARFFLQYMRELRSALDRIGKRRGRRFEIAMHVVNSLRACAYYGMDVPAMVAEGLVDILIPSRGHFIPEEFGEKHATPEYVAEFVRAAAGTGVRVRPAWEGHYYQDTLSFAERARAFYGAGVDGFVAGGYGGSASAFALSRRLGHRDDLDRAEAAAAGASRRVGVWKIMDMPFDMKTGTPTCG